MTGSLCNVLFKNLEADLTPLLVATAVQFVVGSLYYGVLVANPWRVAMARDKGVRKLENVVFRYSGAFAVLVTIACAFLKAAAILAVVNLIGAQANSLCMYQQIAAFTTAIVATVAHNGIWEQRPIVLLILTIVGEIANQQAAAFALYKAKSL